MAQLNSRLRNQQFIWKTYLKHLWISRDYITSILPIKRSGFFPGIIGGLMRIGHPPIECPEVVFAVKPGYDRPRPSHIDVLCYRMNAPCSV